MNTENNIKTSTVIKIVVFGILGLIALIWCISFGAKIYNRYQVRMDASNEVFVNEIKIKQQEQLIQVEKQKAEIRIVEAKGIAEAQSIINATLTDKYLQHEAIKAQGELATSPNHTTIYIPSGQNGIPLVKTIE